MASIETPVTQETSDHSHRGFAKRALDKFIDTIEGEGAPRDKSGYYVNGSEWFAYSPVKAGVSLAKVSSNLDNAFTSERWDAAVEGLAEVDPDISVEEKYAQAKAAQAKSQNGNNGPKR